MDSANGLSIWKTIDEEKETVLYHIFDIKKKTFIKKYIDSKIPLFFICQDCFVCRNSIAEVSVFNFKIQKQLWQKDLSEITSYTDWDGEHKGEIYNVYSYKNRIIVVAGNSVLSLEKDNGVIEWQTTYDDFQPHTLHIVENIGYLCRGAYYSLINLNTGEKLLEIKLLRPFNLSLKYKNSNVAMVRSDMTYHEGYFYFTDKSEEHRYLGKIEPQTGIVEEYQILEGITSSIHPPKFHKDKMFLLDSESNLHIYQKDKTLES